MTNTVINKFKNKKIIVFGAGKIGKLTIGFFNEENIKLTYIWDNNFKKCDPIKNYEITKPNFELKDKDKYIIIVTIFAQEISKEIKENFKSNGFTNIIYKREDLNNIFYQKCKYKLDNNTFSFKLNKCHLCPCSKDINNRCDIYDKFVEKELTKKNYTKSLGVTIPSMGILVSNKCNLKCIGCNQLRDKYDSTSYLDLNYKDIISDMRKISKSVDLIEKVVLVGGEPFLYKNIEEVIEELLDIENIGIIQLITNGTILPKNEKIYSLLASPKIKIEISSYEDYITAKQNKNVLRMIDTYKKYNINFDYIRTLQWFDFGDFKHRGYNKKELSKVYNSCCFISNDLFNGQLHKCARSAFSTHLNIIDDLDYVNIREGNEEKLTEKIKKFLENKSPKICHYCNGTSSLTIPAGKQKRLSRN
ncbi:MAG: hypothetical protein C0625_09590 [Arcobacter sp.]|nr:MAG: hypothetical protein C0625_09590 [Arcobacter sp.]